MGLIDLEPDPQERKPRLERGGGAGWTVLEAAAGVGGYMALAMGCGYVGGLLHAGVGSWGLVPLVTVVPLGLVGGAAYFFKSRAMLAGAVVPCAVVLLSCGTCAALASGMG